MKRIHYDIENADYCLSETLAANDYLCFDKALAKNNTSGSK